MLSCQRWLGPACLGSLDVLTLQADFGHLSAVTGLSSQRHALDEWRASWVTDERRGELLPSADTILAHAAGFLPVAWLMQYAASFRLGHLGLIYYHYAQIVLRLQYLRIVPASDAVAARWEAVEHASLLVDYAARFMPADVYRYAHNNAFTMISCGAAITLHVRVYPTIQPPMCWLRI